MNRVERKQRRQRCRMKRCEAIARKARACGHAAVRRDELALANRCWARMAVVNVERWVLGALPALQKVADALNPARVTLSAASAKLLRETDVACSVRAGIPDQYPKMRPPGGNTP